MKSFIAILFSCFVFYSYGQISHGGQPISFSEPFLLPAPTFTTPVIDATPFLKEDAITDQYKDIPPRFGVEQFVNLTLNNNGIWETLPNGDKVWRLIIHSPNALSINLNFDDFYLPQGATFFVFNKNQTLGAFTHLNNKTTGEFSTAPIKGEKITLEYTEPLSVKNSGRISIKSVVHGYRNFWEQLKVFGSSGSCNVNAICDTSFWGNEIRSAVMLLTSGNTRFCSGALITNVPKDGTPYVLTANHCGPATDNIFMFNYQSSNCSSSVDGSTSQTISGCILRANNPLSDFYLVELSSVPPSSYNVFYAGWSALNTPATSATGIHFPAGDVKKISHDFEPLLESGYYATGNDHWQVLDWNTGTTEGGSSGSPLFNQNHRIVGQLHGGDAACSNDAFDYYGKFSLSWNSNPDTTKQLKRWLDPNNTGTLTIDGYDPNGPQLVNDAVLLNIQNIPSFICGDTITPKIIIRNHGSTTLTSLDISYQLDGGTIANTNWTGNLTSYEIDSIVLPKLFVSSGNRTFTAICSNPNGTTDNNSSNDTASFNFIANNNPTFATAYLTIDDYGTETSWIIRHPDGTLYLEGNGYPNNNSGMLFTESLCLFDTCFTFILKDAFGDGFCCGFGNGELHLTNNFGDTIYSNTTFNSDSLVIPFCLNSSTSIKETSTNNEFIVFPNPTHGKFKIINQLNDAYQLFVFDVLGKAILKRNKLTEKEIEFDLSNQNKGMYFIQITSKNKVITKRLILR